MAAFIVVTTLCFFLCFSRCYSFHDDFYKRVKEKRVFFKEQRWDWNQKPTICTSEPRHVWISLPFEFDTKWHIRVGWSANITYQNRRLVIKILIHISRSTLKSLCFFLFCKENYNLAVYVRFIKDPPYLLIVKCQEFFCWDFMDITTVVVIPVLLQRRRSFVILLRQLYQTKMR